MFKFFDQLYPAYNSAQRQILLSILSGIIIFFIFFVMQPFRINLLSPSELLKFSLVYGAVTLSVLLIVTVLLPQIFPNVFIESRWSVGKEIIFTLGVILCIALGNVVANYYLVQVPIGINTFLKMAIGTAIIGILPITLSVALKQKILLQRYKNQSDTLNTVLQNIKPNENITTELITPPVIKLVGDNQSEVLELAPENLWFLSSADNYVNIVFEQKNSLQSVLFRSTLKKMETALEGFQTIVRCHKGFIVNLDKIENVEASAQGLKLKLVQCTETVSVGKTFTEIIKRKVQKS